MTLPTAAPGRPSASLHFVVGEMNGKIDQLLLTLLPQLTSLDTRVSSVERFQWYLAGGGTLVVFLVSGWEVFRYVIRL